MRDLNKEIWRCSIAHGACSAKRKAFILKSSFSLNPLLDANITRRKITSTSSNRFSAQSRIRFNGGQNDILN